MTLVEELKLVRELMKTGVTPELDRRYNSIVKRILDNEKL